MKNNLEYQLKDLVMGMVNWVYYFGGIYKVIPKKYVLERKNSLDGCKIFPTPEMLKNPKYDEIKTYGNNFIDGIVKNFYTTMKEKLPLDNLTNLENNLSSLKIDDRKNVFYDIPAILMVNIFGKLKGGIYSPSYNKIKLSNEEILNKILMRYQNSQKIRKIMTHITYHELMHMCSTTRQSLLEKNFSGFHQYDKLLKVDVGRGINEGYTELLTRRYFGEINENSYDYERTIASLLETLVGKDKMEHLYFTSDLQGLVDEISKYSSQDDTKQFILDVDVSSKFNFSNNFRGKNATLFLKKTNNRIFNFLANSYLKKLNDSLNNKEITKEMYQIESLEYIKKIQEISNSFYKKYYKQRDISNFDFFKIPEIKQEDYHIKR